MNVWVKVEIFPGCMKRHNYAGRAGKVFIDITLPSCPGGLVKYGVKLAVKFEVDSKTFGNCKYQVSMREGK